MPIDDLKKRLEQIDQSTEFVADDERLINYKDSYIEISKKELQEAVDSNPNHPLANTYRQALKRVFGGSPVTVIKAQLMALIENRSTITESVIPDIQPDGIPVEFRTVQVGEKLPVTSSFPEKSYEPPQPLKTDSIESSSLDQSTGDLDSTNEPTD